MIRNADLSDIDNLKCLWKESFNDTDEFIQWFFEHVFEPENSFLLEENNTCIAAFHTIQNTLIYHGKPIKAVTICGLSTCAEYRNKGKMKLLLQEGLKLLRNRNIDVALLIPVQREYYHKFGFETMSGLYVADIPHDHFSDEQIFQLVLSKNEPLNNTTAKIHNHLEAQYKNITKHADIFMTRNEKEWEYILKSGMINGEWVIHLPDIYIHAVEREYGLEVMEILWENGSSLCKYIAILMLQINKGENLRLRLGHTTDVIRFFTELNINYTLAPLAMARILIPENIIKAMPAHANNDSITLNDDIITENNRTYQSNVQSTYGNITVTPREFVNHTFGKFPDCVKTIYINDFSFE